MTNGGGTQLGIVERLATIVSSLTLQNALVFCILVAIAIPSYAVWQIMTDSALRKEIMSYAKEQDLGIPCQVITYSFSGQNERTAIISQVQVWGQFEIIVGTKTPGQFTANEGKAACDSTNELAAKLRAVMADMASREKK